MAADSDDDRVTRYALRDDIESQRVCFAPLLEVISDYDTESPHTTFQQDYPNNDGTHTRPQRRFPNHRHPSAGTRATIQPPRAYPMLRHVQQREEIQILPPVPLPTQPMIPPLPPPPLHPPHTTEASIRITNTTAPMTPVNNPTNHITLTTYNVISARGTRLLEALRAMQELNTDIAVLTEAKVTHNKHARQSHGYNVFASLAPSSQQGGVVLAWRSDPKHWILEGMRAISPNSVSATLVSGEKRWLLLGTYLSPNEPPDMELTALEAEYQRNAKLPVILLGDLNVDIDNQNSERGIAIATTLQHLGVTDIIRKFPQKHKRHYTRHRVLHDRTHQRSRCDYALTDPSINVKSIRLVIPPRFHSDHWAVKMQIRSDNQKQHRQYLHNRTCLPLITPEADEHGPNRIFAQLLEFHERQIPPAYAPRDAWIANDTWTLIDRRTAALRRLATQDELRPLRKAIRKKIKRDRAARLHATGEEIQAHLDADNAREAWRLVKVWYRHHARAVPPTPADLKAIKTDFKTLYTRLPSPNEAIRGMVTFDIPDTVPTSEEIGLALKTLRLGRAPGPSGMTVEDIRRWYATRETTPEPWTLATQLVQHAFQTGIVPTRARSNTLVLIPKPEAGQVRGIGLLEPIWKLISAIVNRRLMDHIKFHDDLHGFLPGRGTGTACLEAKLEAQLAFQSGNPLYQVYLDFAKAYDSLDCEHTLVILKDYGVGPNILRLIATFWDRHMVTPRQQRFYGTPFPADRGLATGDIPAPVIFNIVTDAVLRRWYSAISDLGLTTKAKFYADDGALRDNNPIHLQTALATMEDLFMRVGLYINGRKTKALTITPTISTSSISTTAYKRRMEGEGDSYRDRKKYRISCPICDTEMQARSLHTHYRAKHPTIPIPRPNDPPAEGDHCPTTYLIMEPNKHATIQCPVNNCTALVRGGWYAIRRHFYFRHHCDQVNVIEEGHLPGCHKCGFQCKLPHESHQQSELCLRGQQRRLRRATTQDIIVARDFAPEFTAGETTLDVVPAFKYLGRWMASDDSDVMAVTQNISKARMRWGQLCRLLTRRGASRRVMGLFYKATIQAILLYGAETWTLTQPLLRLLNSFHHRCARYLARMVNTQDEDGEWTTPASEIVLAKAGLFTIEEYIQRRVNTFMPFIQSRAIYRECQASRATQAAATHPCWWTINPAPPNIAEPIMQPLEPIALSDQHQAENVPLPLPPPPPRRSPRREVIVV